MTSLDYHRLGNFRYAIITLVGDDGFPFSVSTDFKIMPDKKIVHEHHGTLTFEPEKVSEWDEKILPFDQYCAKTAPQGAKYLGKLQASVGA